MHQGVYFDDQLALKTFVAASSTKWNPVELCLTLQTRNPFLDPSRLHEILQHEHLIMCLITMHNNGFIMELVDIVNEHIIILR